MTELTQGKLGEIREWAEMATPGPWRQSSDEGHIWSGEKNPLIMVIDGFRGSSRFNDCEFIAASRNDIPALLDHITTLTAERDRLRDALQAIWGLSSGDMPEYDDDSHVLNKVEKLAQAALAPAPPAQKEEG